MGVTQRVGVTQQVGVTQGLAGCIPKGGIKRLAEPQLAHGGETGYWGGEHTLLSVLS